MRMMECRRPTFAECSWGRVHNGGLNRSQRDLLVKFPSEECCAAQGSFTNDESGVGIDDDFFTFPGSEQFVSADRDSCDAVEIRDVVGG